jgi:hypothetical protein
MGSSGPAGALNYITPAEVLAAVGEVRLGRSATMASPVETNLTADNPDPGEHQMTRPGRPPSGRYTSRSAVNRPLLTAWRSAW